MEESTVRSINLVKPPKNDDISFKVMTEKEVGDYMIHLVETNGSELIGVEKQVERALREVAKQRKDVVSQIDNIQLKLSELEKNNTQLIGQMNALGFILQKAEDERRWEKKQKESEVEEEKEE